MKFIARCETFSEILLSTKQKKFKHKKAKRIKDIFEWEKRGISESVLYSVARNFI